MGVLPVPHRDRPPQGLPQHCRLHSHSGQHSEVRHPARKDCNLRNPHPRLNSPSNPYLTPTPTLISTLIKSFAPTLALALALALNPYHHLNPDPSPHLTPTSVLPLSCRESCCEAKGGFTVGFLEKSVSDWWSKYILLVT